VGLLPAGSLMGCEDTSGGEAESHALDGFLTATLALGALYTATIAAQPVLAPGLTPLRDAHQAHASALAAALGREVPAAPETTAAPAADEAGARAALATAEAKARDDAVAACLATSPRLAALLGSIAAARASHLEIVT
jgi:hypothetical protein